MPEETTKQAHESFGLLQINRVEGHTNLFGCHADSSSHFIQLVIRSAVRYRRLHQDSYSDGAILFSGYLSPAQYTEAITSLTTGACVPFTLRRQMGREVPPCPTQRGRFHRLRTIHDAMSIPDQLLTPLRDRLQLILTALKAPTRGDAYAIVDDLRKVQDQMLQSIQRIPAAFAAHTQLTDGEVRQATAHTFRAATARVGLPDMTPEDVFLLSDRGSSSVPPSDQEQQRKTVPEAHESYALLQIQRVRHEQPVNLFGSSLRHVDAVQISILPAVYRPNDATSWYQPAGEPLVVAEMSVTQFADALTLMNVATGVPCTLRQISGNAVPSCPADTAHAEFQAEIEAEVQEAQEQLRAILTAAQALAERKKPPTKAEIRELDLQVERLRTWLISDVPFIWNQYNGYAVRVETELKGAIDAMLQGAVHQAGVQALRAQAAVEAPARKAAAQMPDSSTEPRR